MTELTQLERARRVAEGFEPTEPSQDCYCYLFLGQASWDASSYELIDGQYLMSKRVWHVDQSKPDCVCYVGRGQNGRIDQELGHPVMPSAHLRIKLKSGLSYSDSIDLERQLIQELGCICDADRDDGCLVNLRYHESGPFCCPFLEATAYKLARNGQKGNVTRTIDAIAMAENRTIVSRGSAGWLARELRVDDSSIIKCCRQQKGGIWQASENRALYFCYADDYERYEIIPMTNKELNKNRILIAAKVDGSDICCGTAVEIGTYAPEIKQPGHLHKVAQGKKATAYGWTARYLGEISDESNTDVVSCVPNLSAFF